MLDRILQSCLQNTKQTKRDVRGQNPGHAFGREINLDALPLGDFTAEACGRHDQAKLFENCRVQSMGNGLDVPAQYPGLRDGFLDLLENDIGGFANGSPDVFQMYGEEGESLTNVVVQFSSDA